MEKALTIALIIGVVQLLASAMFCVMIAREKHRDTLGWFFAGLLFGITALLTLLGLKDLYEVKD